MGRGQRLRNGSGNRVLLANLLRSRLRGRGRIAGNRRKHTPSTGITRLSLLHLRRAPVNVVVTALSARKGQRRTRGRLHVKLNTITHGVTQFLKVLLCMCANLNDCPCRYLRKTQRLQTTSFAMAFQSFPYFWSPWRNKLCSAVLHRPSVVVKSYYLPVFSFVIASVTRSYSLNTTTQTNPFRHGAILLCISTTSTNTKQSRTKKALPLMLERNTKRSDQLPREFDNWETSVRFSLSPHCPLSLTVHGPPELSHGKVGSHGFVRVEERSRIGFFQVFCTEYRSDVKK